MYGGTKKRLGSELTSDFLNHRRRLDPHRLMAAAVMIVIGHREHAAAGDAKRTLAPRLFLEHLGQRKTYLAQFQDCGIGIVILARMRHRSAYFLFVAIHQVLPEVSFTPPTRSPQVMSAGSLIALAPKLTARL